FADTHNVVAILEKSDAAEGFEQIIDFISGSYIHYALTVSPHIYISCIKQFWNSVSVKRSGDVTRDVAEEAEAHVPAQGDNVQELAAEEVVPPTPMSSSPPSPVIPSSPPHQPPCAPQPQDAEGSSFLFQQVLATCSDLALRVEDEGIELVADQENDAEFKGRHADKQAKIYNIHLDHSSKVLSMQEDDTEVQE
nr:hypothetical protein [Tanacetum cinerariifolium]